MDLALRGGGEQSVELGLGASDPARELGGAFGIALLGRIDNTAYPSNIDLSGVRLSAGARAIAERFSDGEALTAQAASAFTDAFKVANWISIGIAVAAPRDPRRRTPAAAGARSSLRGRVSDVQGHLPRETSGGMIQPTGATLDVSTADLWHVSDGKILELMLARWACCWTCVPWSPRPRHDWGFQGCEGGARPSGCVSMTSEPIRDPVGDHLLTAQNSALVVIDYQPSQIQTVTSMDRELLVDNIVSVALLAKTFDLPVVLSTINVAGGQQPTVPELRAVLADDPEIDRTSINSWEDVEFRRAVEATGRKKLIMTALWTEVCLAFPALDALRDGYEVFPVVDAVGGTSREAHRAGLERIVQAGAQPISWVSLACELQRDWARTETVADVVDIVLTTRLLAA